MTIVNITKQPLYGTVYWDGLKFVYTPNDANANNNDFFLYTKTVDGVTTSYVEKINTGNLPPSTNTVSVTANASTTITFNVNDLATDATKPFGELQIKNVNGITKGNGISDGVNIYYTANYTDYVETFNYVVSDGQYDSTGTITVSVINGYVAPPKALNFEELLRYYSGVINFLSNQVVRFNWLYDTLTTYSDYLDGIDYVKYNTTSDNILSSYNNWNNFYNKTSSYLSNYNTLQLNSSIWNNTASAVDDTATLLYKDYSVLDKVVNILYFNRYKWSDAITKTSEHETTLTQDDFVTKLNNTYNTITSNSALWDGVELNKIYQNSLIGVISATNVLNNRYTDWYNLSSDANSLSATNQKYTDIYDDINDSINSINGNLLNDILTIYIPSYESYSYYINNAIDKIAINNLYNSTTAVSSSFYKLYSKISDFYNFIQNNISNFKETATSKLSSLSSNYESSYSIVNSLYDKWTTEAVQKISNSYNTTETNSGKWNLLNDKLSLSADIWENTYNTITSFDGSLDPNVTFLNKGSSYTASYNNLTVLGNLTSQNVSCFGVNTTISTLVFTTSSYDIINTSSDNLPAIYVNKSIPNSKSLLNLSLTSAPVLYVNSNNTVNINLSSGGTKALNVVGNISATGYIYNIFNDQIAKYNLLSSTYETTYTSAQYISNNFGVLCSLSSRYQNVSNYVTLSSDRINTTLSATSSYYSAYNNLTSLSARNKTLNDFVSLCSPIFGVDSSFRNNSAFYENFYAVTTSIDKYV